MVDFGDEESYRADSAECNWGVITHLSTLIGFVVPFANVVCPLAILLTKGRESRFIEAHARESLNFQISILAYAVVGGVLAFVLVGFLVLAGVFVLNLIGVVQAAVQASKGRAYAYPLTFRLVKG